MERNVGVDFYQYWAVGLGPKLTKGELKSPYVDLKKYVATFDAYVQKTNDLRLFAVNKVDHRFYEHGLDIPGTPLLYAVFAASPLDYSWAFFLFSSAKTVLFAMGVLLLLLRTRSKLSLLMSVSLAVAFDFGPLVNDLKAGNIAALQFFVIVFLAYVLEARSTRKALHRWPYASGVMFMSILTLFLLVKPNILFVTCALSASLWLTRGTKVFALSTAAALFFGSLLIAIPCLYYGSWSVWNDWHKYFSDVGNNNFYPVQNGNVSTTLLLADAFGTVPGVIWPITLTALSAHALFVILANKPASASAARYIKSVTAFLLKDPFLCASSAIVVTLAISPLVWRHYYVLSLIPAFWLMSIKPRFGILDRLPLLSLFLSSEILPTLFPPLRTGTPQYWLMASAWIPLWFCIQTVIAERLRHMLPEKETNADIPIRRVA